MPVIGLGTWKSKENEVYTAVYEALKIGYRHIDCAWAYDNEHVVGRAINDAIKEGIIKREDLFVTSKLWNKFHKSDQVEAALRETLGHLQLAYLDLYLMHWPNSWAFTEEEVKEAIPVQVTWQAMEACVDQGLVRNIGVSNFSCRKLKEVLAYARHPVAVNQCEGHPYLRNDPIVQLCAKEGVVFTAYSPLGSSDSESMKEAGLPKVLEHEHVLHTAKVVGKSPGQVLIRWAIQRGTIAIPKSANPERIKQNFDVLDWEIPEQCMKKLNSIEFQKRFVSGSGFVGQKKPYKSISDLWDGEFC